MAIRKVLEKQVGYCERKKGEVLVSDANVVGRNM